MPRIDPFSVAPDRAHTILAFPVDDYAGHRIHVAAPKVLAAVRFAGGLIFDRAMAGWSISVFVPDHPDERPLRILGADVRALDSLSALKYAASHPRAVAIAADLYDDNRVRQTAHLALTHVGAECLSGGESWPSDLRTSFGLVQYRLSNAAHAFKAQALRAAGADPTTDPTESFCCQSTNGHTLSTGGRDLQLIGPHRV